MEGKTDHKPLKGRVEQSQTQDPAFPDLRSLHDIRGTMNRDYGVIPGAVLPLLCPSPLSTHTQSGAAVVSGEMGLKCTRGSLKEKSQRSYPVV